jgi:hypothetical protein
VKPTHGSGAVLAISPDAPADAVVPDPGEDWVCRFVRPEAVDPERLERLAAGWLARLHGHGPNFEWAYGLVPRRILVEELLTGPDGSPPDDYKLFVFNGQCRFVQFDANRFVRHAQAFFDRDWRQLHFHTGCPPAEPVPSRPAHLAEMIEVAERIGRDTDMVRVDFYLVGDRIVVGELTSYPGAGTTRFCPPSYDAEFGRYWTVPARYV